VTLEMGGTHDDLATAEQHRDFLERQIASSQDPTERKRLETELAAAEQSVAQLEAEVQKERGIG